MKGGAREGAGRKKKAVAKETAMQKGKTKSLSDKVVRVTGETRPNKHHSYLKVMMDEESGKLYVGAKDGADIFFFGTHDSDLIDKISDQIIGVCFRDGEVSEVKIREANATLAAITEMDPQDPTELMLATQMTTVHNTVMSVFSRVLKADQPIELAEFYINSATKLMRTYTAQIEALNKYRAKGQQKITVQHVNVNDGGQAVIGDVNQGGGNG